MDLLLLCTYCSYKGKQKCVLNNYKRTNLVNFLKNLHTFLITDNGNARSVLLNIDFKLESTQF